MTYERRLIRAYGAAFPPAQVSFLVSDAPAAVTWSSDLVAAAAQGNLSVPVIDRALRRGEAASRALCAPHLLCDCTQEGTLDRLSPSTLRTLRAGKHLDALGKAELGLLADPALRVRLCVAYVANRCLRHSYRRACLPFFFEAERGGHANLLVVQLEADALLVELYEPNGREAAEAYGTLDRFFGGFERLRKDLLEPRPVRLRVVGAGLQTFLGETTVRRTATARITRSRGYPVCEAVVLYVMRAYMNQPRSASLEAFELGLFDARDDTRAALLAFVEELADWVAADYARALNARLSAIFADSNVRRLDVQYGDVAVTTEP